MGNLQLFASNKRSKRIMLCAGNFCTLAVQLY